MTTTLPEGAKVAHNLERKTHHGPWPSGPWDDEPDRVEWREGGFVCLVLRGPSGALCGYVGVEPGHPWHGRPFPGLSEDGIEADAHGGITYAEGCAPKFREGEQVGICHAVEPGEPEHLWWVGFDCAHAWDVCPSYGADMISPDSAYRHVGYVVAEVRRLREQAEAARVAS